MWELDHKEGWMLKNQCLQIVVLKKTLQSPLDCKEIKPVNLKGNQPCIIIGKTEAEAPIVRSPYVKSQLIGKDPDAGKDWRWDVKGMTEDETVGWHHQHNRNETEQALGVGDGQESLACYIESMGSAKSRTKLSNWTTHIIVNSRDFLAILYI